jgi:toxin ParE1/3/4
MADGYRLSKEAAGDIRHIFREGQRLFGRDQAQKYHLYLESTFNTIAANPRLARERREISPPVRIHPCGSHIIVYVFDGAEQIHIIRVRHHRENWKPRT